MSRTEQVVAEALSWVGTPYRHQASCKGAGTDCLGLLRGVWREVFGAEPQGREELLWAAERHLVCKPVSDTGLGDVLLFRMRRGAVAKHLGLQVAVGAEPAFVHAYSGQGVTVSPFSEPWARRVAARFSFPT